jgi:hypothetical protein
MTRAEEGDEDCGSSERIEARMCPLLFLAQEISDIVKECFLSNPRSFKKHYTKLQEMLFNRMSRVTFCCCVEVLSSFAMAIQHSLSQLNRKS